MYRKFNQKIRDLNPTMVPFVETDYYKWLVKRKDRRGHWDLRYRYLCERGAVLGAVKIDKDVLVTLRHIHDIYYFKQHLKFTRNISGGKHVS